MKIGEYEQMMAYLKKPNRLFTSKRQNTIGGGTIEGDNLGSRTGFKGPELIQRGENKGKYRVKYRDPQFGKRKDGKGYNEGYTDPMTKKQAQKFYDDRQKKMGELKSSGPIDIKTKQTEQINNFVNNFIDQNIKSYGIRDYDQFEKDMIKAFKKSGIKDASGRSALSGNLPNIGTQESRAPFTKFGLDPAYRQKVRKDLGRESDLQNHFKKIFYSGVLENNSDLRNKISRYLDYENIDKKYRGLETDVNRAALKKQYADVLTPEVESDFIYMMDEMEQSKLRGTIFKKYFGNKYDKFIEKRNTSMKQYQDAIKDIERKLSPETLKEILGETSIKGFMNKQHELLNKIFDTSVFTGPDRGLVFAADHLEGIAEIAKYENEADIIRGLQNVAGTTVARNRELGWKTLSRPRRDLINKIQKGINVEDNVKELNRITKLSYPDFKGNNFYKYDPATKNVVPTKNFVVKYNPEDAFKRYFTELATTEKGAKGLLQQAKPGSELVQFLTKDEKTYKNIANNLFNQLKENKDVSLKELTSLRNTYKNQKEKALQEFGRLFCRTNSATGGRINLAQAGSANICSPDEMLSNMKKDRAIAQGTDEAAVAAKGRLLKAGKSVGKVLGYVAAPADIAIELAFAGPSLLRGDIQGAINATTFGMLGGGKTGMEQVGEKFGTDSTEYALYGMEESIKNKMIAMDGLEKLFSQSEQLGLIPSEQGVMQKQIGLEPQQKALLKQFVSQFKNLGEIDQKAQQDFETFYPLTVDKMKNTEALQNIADFSTAQQPLAGKLDPKTVEGFIKGAGGYFKKEMAPRFTLPQYEENIQRLKELRIADFPVDLQSQLAAYEKSQMPSQQQQDLMLRQQLQSPLDFTVPYDQLRYKGFKEGGRINFSNGGRLTFYVGGGADMGGVADSQGNVGPSGGGNNDGPDDRSTAAQTAAHNAAVAAAQAANKAAEQKMNIVNTLNKFRPNAFVNPYNYSVGLNKNIGPFGFNFGINTLGILGIDDPRTEEDESEQDDYGISAGYNTDLFGGNLSLGAGYNPTTGTNLGLSFSKQFNQGGRVSFADGPEDPSKRKTLKKIGIGGGIAGGLMTGLINIMDLFKGAKTGIAATKAAETEAQRVFFDLVNAVKNKGVMNKLDDLLETKVGVKYEYKGVEVLEDGENIELRFNTDTGAPAVVEYRKPGYEVDPDAQTSYKVPGEFIAEGQEVGRIGKGGDVDLDFEEEIIDSFEDAKKIIDD